MTKILMPALVAMDGAPNVAGTWTKNVDGVGDGTGTLAL
jgi:hypothetical protein